MLAATLIRFSAVQRVTWNGPRDTNAATPTAKAICTTVYCLCYGATLRYEVPGKPVVATEHNSRLPVPKSDSITTFLGSTRDQNKTFGFKWRNVQLETTHILGVVVFSPPCLTTTRHIARPPFPRENGHYMYEKKYQVRKSKVTSNTMHSKGWEQKQ